MIAVKGGEPKAGPTNARLVFRAEPTYGQRTMAAKWHMEQKWRHDNIQPHPSKFVTDLNLGNIKKLDAAVEKYLWSETATAEAQVKGLLSAFETELSTALNKYELKTITKVGLGLIHAACLPCLS